MLYRIYSWFWRMYSYVQLACGAVPSHWRGNPWFFRILHYGLVLVIFGLLCYFSEKLMPESKVNLTHPLLRRYWCGVVFLLSYVAVRFIVYLIGLLRESDGSDWPQIDEAWQIGMEGLEREGLDFQRLPVFLLTGCTAETEKRFFEGCQCGWQVVEPAPDRPAAIRFYANQDGIFISCAGISASSQQVRRSSSGPGVATSNSVAASPAEPAGFHGGTMRGLSSIPSLASTPTAAMPSPASHSGFGGTLKNIASLVQSTLGMTAASRLNVGGPSDAELRPLGNSELDLYRMQMEYLATILKRDRTYCPLNGVLQLIPYSWLNKRRQHVNLSRSIKKDFEALSRSLRLQFPVTLAVVGLESVMGYDAFIRRCRELHPQSHLMRAGGGFASGTLLDEAGASYLSQITSTCFRDKAYETFLSDLDNPLNPRLYHLVCELDDEVDNLKHLLQTIGGPASGGPELARHSGCYVAALGESTDGQAFLQGLLVKLLQEQNQVAYTPTEVRRDRWRYRIALGLFVAAAGILAWAGTLAWELLQPTDDLSESRARVTQSDHRRLGSQTVERGRDRS